MLLVRPWASITIFTHQWRNSLQRPQNHCRWIIHVGSVKCFWLLKAPEGAHIIWLNKMSVRESCFNLACASSYSTPCMIWILIHPWMFVQAESFSPYFIRKKKEIQYNILEQRPRLPINVQMAPKRWLIYLHMIYAGKTNIFASLILK